MKLRINGKIYPIPDQDTPQLRDILSYWYNKKLNGERVVIECLCIENRKKHPLLYINTPYYNSNHYYLANKPSSMILHDWNCPNKKIDSFREKGIKEHQDGNFTCYVSFKNNKEKDKDNLPTIPFSTLFHTLLQIVDIHVYKHNQPRNLSKRLEVAARKIKVNGQYLKGKGFSKIYIATKKMNKDGTTFLPPINYNPGHPYSPLFIIGWGNIDFQARQKKGFTVSIPLYSVDDHSDYITDVKVYEPLYNQALNEYKNNQNKVLQGYWIIWREPKRNFFKEKEVAFIPAEEMTGIPVNSIFEASLIRELLKHHRFFKKPLVDYEVITKDIKYKPDFVLLDTYPRTILEVIEETEAKSQKTIKERKEDYIKAGYRYLEWRTYDPKHTLNSLRLDLK